MTVELSRPARHQSATQLTSMTTAYSLRAARQRLEQILTRQPNDRQTLSQLVHVLDQLDAFTDLLQLLDEAVVRWPQDSNLCMSRARIHKYLGRFADARADYVKILTQEPGHIAALCSLVMQGHGDDVGGLQGVEARLAAADVTDSQRTLLCYARARLLEQAQRFEEAFETFREANARRAAAGGMNITAKQRGAKAVLSDINSEIIARHFGTGNPSQRPVFIVGMPRSGSTLTEQVLACHPDVYAAGERLFWREVLGRLVRSAPPHNGSMVEAIGSLHPQVWEHAGTDYLRRISEINGDAIRITDKLPANFGLLPFTRLIFPRAHIIHVRRNPLATIASCIRVPFDEPELAFTVEDWARFYGIYQALIDSWRPMLRDQLLEIDYEELVNDLPTQARRLIHFLGLHWNDACLHPHLNRRAVRTASLQQVRREVHTGSINAWRCYEVQLEALQPIIDKSYDEVFRTARPPVLP